MWDETNIGIAIATLTSTLSWTYIAIAIAIAIVGRCGQKMPSSHWSQPQAKDAIPYDLVNYIYEDLMCTLQGKSEVLIEFQISNDINYNFLRTD